MRQISLMYHDVYFQSPGESGLAADMYKISVSQFEEHIKRICDLKKLVSSSIVLTFDDGGSSFYAPISQLLDKYSLKGYFFVATDYIGKTGFLSEEQIIDIEKRGHIIGTHSHFHPENISTLSPIEIEFEWVESVRILSRILGHTIQFGSIPNGYQSDIVLNAAAKAGIKELFTSEPLCKERRYKDLTLFGRFVVLSGMTDDDILTLILSKKKRLLLRLKWLALKAPKYLLGDKYEVVKQRLFR